MQIIYEDDEIVVKETENETDFIAIIENKSEETIAILPDGDNDSETIFEAFEIYPYDWVGILADEEGRNALTAIKQGKFSTNFNSDYV